MSLSDRMDFSGIGYEGQTPYFNIIIDYGPAFQASADAFMSDATSLCPIDTGFLYSTIGASADGEGMTAYADADYAVYVNGWANFFDVGWQTALTVADATCDAIYNDAMVEEYEMILTERDEALTAQQAIIDDILGQIEQKEQEKTLVENMIAEVEAQIDMLEDMEGMESVVDMLEEQLKELEEQLEGIEDELSKLETDKEQADIEYQAIEDYYETILAYY